jgi:hypothetical protein
VGRSNGGCAETAPLRIEPESGKVPQNDVESSRGQGRDVLEERQRRRDFFEDACDVRPEPSFVGEPEPLTGIGPRLAGEPASDEVHLAAPWVAVEGREIVPDRSLIHARLFHPRHESGRSEGFPLDVTHNSVGVAEGESESELQSSDAGAEGESSEGTYSHVTPPRSRLRASGT